MPRDTCTEYWDTMRGFTKINTNQTGKKSFMSGIKILLHYKANQHSFGIESTGEQGQILEHQSVKLWRGLGHDHGPE